MSVMTKINTKGMAIPTAKQFLEENKVNKSLWNQNRMVLLCIQEMEIIIKT